MSSSVSILVLINLPSISPLSEVTIFSNRVAAHNRQTGLHILRPLVKAAQGQILNKTPLLNSFNSATFSKQFSDIFNTSICV